MTTLDNRIQERRGNYGYRIKKLSGGSDRYGTCEICKNWVDVMYYQVECRKTETGWTYHNCHALFGHQHCLESKRNRKGG